MSRLIRDFLVGLCVAAAVVLPACGNEQQVTERVEAEVKEGATDAGFTNVDVNNIDSYPGGTSAKVIVSVGGCRIKLYWNSEKGFSARVKEIDDLPGELTADVFRKHADYQECAKEPAPGESPTPSR
jgi:hypothetical protein